MSDGVGLRLLECSIQVPFQAPSVSEGSTREFDASTSEAHEAVDIAAIGNAEIRKGRVEDIIEDEVDLVVRDSNAESRCGAAGDGIWEFAAFAIFVEEVDVTSADRETDGVGGSSGNDLVQSTRHV